MRRTLNLARGADIALIGVGDLGPDSHMSRMGWFSAQELQSAREAGVAGDLLGYDFSVTMASRPAPTSAPACWG